MAIAIPRGVPKFTKMPLEIILFITDILSIRDVLKMTQTCKAFYDIINQAEFWRHRMMRDFNCFCFDWVHKKNKSGNVHKDSYKLL